MKQSRHSTDPSATSGNLSKSAKLLLVGTAATMLLEACSANSTPAPTKTVTVTRTVGVPTPHASVEKTQAPKSKPSKTAGPVVMTKSEMPKPLSPRGGDYNKASDIAFEAINDFDFTGSLKDLSKISDPTVRAQAAFVINEATGADAAFEAGDNEQNYSQALSELKLVTDPRVKPKATHAVNEAIAASAAFDATQLEYSDAQKLEALITDPELQAKVNSVIASEKSGHDDTALNTWNDMDTQATSDWDSLNTAATDDWANLDYHIDDYWTQYEQAPDK